jgi:hypothetical protein
MPMVMARFGTALPAKTAAFVCWVEVCNCTTWVRELNAAPGSLNPICPFVPSPRKRQAQSARLGDRLLVAQAFEDQRLFEVELRLACENVGRGAVGRWM